MTRSVLNEPNGRVRISRKRGNLGHGGGEVGLEYAKSTDPHLMRGSSSLQTASLVMGINIIAPKHQDKLYWQGKVRNHIIEAVGGLMQPTKGIIEQW